MVNLVVPHIEFANIRSLNMVFILMSVFIVDFTGRLVFQPRSKQSGEKDHNWFSCKPYRVRLYLTIKCGSNFERHFYNAFYRLVEFDHVRKPSGWKDHNWFSGQLYRVCLYSTFQEGFNRFPVVFI